MKILPNYQTQFNKITEAYIKDEIKPLDPQFCFCGTLSPDSNWRNKELFTKHEYDYSWNEFGEMEQSLFSTFTKETEWEAPGFVNCNESCVNKRLLREEILVQIEEDETSWLKLAAGDTYEDKLFNGMVAALDKLKEIHIRHGEVIDEQPIFQKRILSHELQ